MSQSLRFLLNDEEVALASADPTATLLDYLRLKRRLTGSKEGCAEGDCGACTVLVGRLKGDGLIYEAVNSCIRFLGSLNATHVVTVEHLAAKDGRLHPVQQAMVDCHGSQCGFCTPGFVMSLYGLWLTDENPSRATIERALQGNLCRCTGYEPIVKAAEMMSRTRPSALFDPLTQEKAAIIEKLTAMTTGETLALGDGERRLIVPGNVAALSEALSAHPGATLVAGSTDVGLWVTKQMRALSPVIFINHLAELQKIEVRPDHISFGAGVSYSEAMAVLKDEIPAFGQLIERIGGEQVRNMGTLGGNVANGSPIGDTPPALIALGARMTLTSLRGKRVLPVEDFFIAYGKQDRQSDEFVETITIPRPLANSDFAVHKISKRRDEDISALCGAFYLERAEDGRVKTIRIAFGGMAGTPKRAKAVEAALLGQMWTEETIEAARTAFEEDFQPLSDWRASAGYRLLAAKNLLTRFYLETTGKPQTLQRFTPEEA
ncbi:xanthine dehydrogenase small subunit [Allorhizobium sp. BGMRC 0089]|uniref:xanthine dehydrogenase small subunit n=1 Tax=Allorhizobium sonneratiae TaxID=2934936 RepID=UPI0020337194|nr:xanthine dehydrogenase small subunit [Allorhizobium sonneratiae]MCM2291144.1 xanthine dehydrogenase small subunit [Allorhizobium sonneratiae]